VLSRSRIYIAEIIIHPVNNRVKVSHSEMNALRMNHQERKQPDRNQQKHD
jgi:hypothetical protein